MLIGKLAWGAVVGVVGAVLMSACTYPGPNPAEFGYKRAADGDIVIAYPLCPGHAVAGAAIYVRADDDGGDFDFKTLWQADRPVAKSVEAGVFTVGAPESFQTEKRRLQGDLPNGFYVEVTETFQGSTADGRDGWIDLKRLASADLKVDEFMTNKGKVMTRAEISDQLGCRSANSTP
ncbi:hypothetical protein [Streptomyces justiciae]|uniref:Lipoprotein n=1 Tax=Streptomyces justiciae TaxID=2780140 RepID=A0ABU3M6D5_9ACTN|nr:hypothetical protein [Streptomyces justiciae]MDT7847000.1 hypothetical protein [Streptomyces justiciae]